MRKMGHEQDESPNPRAMCYNFQLGAHCQVCRHQLLHMCAVGGGREGGHGGARENQESDWGGQRLNTSGKQCFLLISVVILHIFQ